MSLNLADLLSYISVPCGSSLRSIRQCLGLPVNGYSGRLVIDVLLDELPHKFAQACGGLS